MQTPAALRALILASFLTVPIELVDAQTASIDSVSCEDIEQNGGTVLDPQGDVTGPGGACPNPFNSGFDAGPTSFWYDEVSGSLYFCSRLFGNIGDSDQDGGYHTETSACGGHPSCVTQESDVFGNVIANSKERVSWSFDRDRNGAADLLFRLEGAANQRADSIRVDADTLTSSLTGLILGGRGVAWQASPVQRNADVVCVQERRCVLVVRIPDWRRYFTVDGTLEGSLTPGLDPHYFGWAFFLGTDNDYYNGDEVVGEKTPVSHVASEEASGPVLQVRLPSPNPFRDRVSLAVRTDAEPGEEFQADVFDLSGRLVRRLGSRFVAAGREQKITWDGRAEDGAKTRSGIYLVRLVSANHRYVSRVARLD
jgi:hypothetical protein